MPFRRKGTIFILDMQVFTNKKQRIFAYIRKKAYLCRLITHK